jgi:hypothetical protein
MPLFYVFLLFMYLPNMVFLMISWVRTPNHIPKSGIWFASHSYGLEIMLLVFAVIYAKTFLELTNNLSTFQRVTRGHFCLKKVT